MCVREDERSNMDQQLFRKAMSMFATGITVVSIYDEKQPIGMTVNAFMSVSLDPMLIAVSIDESATMYDQLNEATNFGVSILNDKQEELSQYFARLKDTEEEVSFIDQNGVPVLKNSLATISCEVFQKVKAGDHLIYIAKVTDIAVNGGEPVLYFGSNYRYLKEM